MITDKVTSLQKRGVDDLDTAFYLLLSAEIHRGKEECAALRDLAREIDMRGNLGLFEPYMEIVEATQQRAKTDYMTGQHIMSGAVTSRVEIFRKNTADLEVSWVIDAALDALGYSEHDLNASELKFLHQTTMRDLLDSEKITDALKT